MNKEPGVSVNPIRRRVVLAIVLAAFSLVALGGCTTGQKAASDYAGAKKNFLQGCVATAKSDNAKQGDGDQDGATKIESPKTYCKCVFDEISAEDGIPYSDFKEIQTRLQDEGGRLPKDFVAAYENCDAAQAASS